MKNLLVAQSGGPSAAINATITGVIDAGIESGRVGHVYGALNGIKGVLNENFVNLDEVCDTKEKRDLLAITPAAALGSCRWKLGNPKENAEEFEEIIRILRKNDIGYFIYTGGNDSMDTVYKLSVYCEEHNIDDIKVMGAPKTIDNDLGETDHCPGFGSAAKFIATAFTEIACDCFVYDVPSVTIVEVMGRNAGWLTAASALARIEQGDLLAREHYIKGNLRLVLSIIQRFSGSSENADDLFQVGCIGLMKAIDNFDRNLNVKFSTYAVPMIIGEVKRYLRDNHSMRVSRSLRDTAYKAINAREVLTKKLNHEPTIDVIAKEIDMKKEDVLFALDAIATPLSLYEPVYQDGGDTLYLMDQVKDKKNKEDSWVESIALKEAMEHLPDREYDIIKMRFFEGKTQTEVADEIAISQAQVSRLEKNALKHMKNHLV